MCATTTTAPAAEKRDRFCRWISLDVKWSLESGLCAALMLRIKGVESFYYVSRLDVGTWRLEKESADHSPPQESYTIETLGEEDPTWWLCSCPDHVWRKRGRKNGCCKHISACLKSLAAIGIDPAK